MVIEVTQIPQSARQIRINKKNKQNLEDLAGFVLIAGFVLLAIYLNAAFPAY